MRHERTKGCDAGICSFLTHSVAAVFRHRPGLRKNSEELTPRAESQKRHGSGLCSSFSPKSLSHDLHNWRARGGRGAGRGRESEHGGRRRRRGARCKDSAHPAARAGDSFESQWVGGWKRSMQETTERKVRINLLKLSISTLS